MTFSAPDLEPSLREWCAQYTDAVNRHDASAIVAHWRFPALIILGERSIVLERPDQFARNTETLMAFYTSQGVSRAVRTLAGVMAMGPGTAAIRVNDSMYTADGTEIVHWTAAYTLVWGSGRWRAIMADAVGETAAWAKRGTPLGGS